MQDIFAKEKQLSRTLPQEVKTLLLRSDAKKYYKRIGKVSDNYVFTEEEQNTLKQIEKLFHAFDADGSGGLDAGELVELYNQNNIPVEEDNISAMFGDDINFTLEHFINITKNKKDLHRYYKSFKEIKEQMLEKAEGARSYMPTTFDETVVEFGFQLNRL